MCIFKQNINSFFLIISCRTPDAGLPHMSVIYKNSFATLSCSVQNKSRKGQKSVSQLFHQHLVTSHMENFLLCLLTLSGVLPLLEFAHAVLFQHTSQDLLQYASKKVLMPAALFNFGKENTVCHHTAHFNVCLQKNLFRNFKTEFPIS